VHPASWLIDLIAAHPNAIKYDQFGYCNAVPSQRRKIMLFAEVAELPLPSPGAGKICIQPSRGPCPAKRVRSCHMFT
jgi:hypothetical protein